MRRAQKRQAEDFLKVLEEAHEEIRAAIENGNYPGALGLLEDCQQGAITLGEMIEAAEGKGARSFYFWRNTVNWCTSAMKRSCRGKQGMGIKCISFCVLICERLRAV